MSHRYFWSAAFLSFTELSLFLIDCLAGNQEATFFLLFSTTMLSGIKLRTPVLSCL